MYSVDYQIMDEEWVTLNVPYAESDALDALMDIWIERDRHLREHNIFKLNPKMSELYVREQALLARYL